MDETHREEPQAVEPGGGRLSWKDGLSYAGIGGGLLLLISSQYLGHAGGIEAWGVGLYTSGLLVYFAGSLARAVPELGRRKPPKGH